jgi:hypothetical protein
VKAILLTSVAPYNWLEVNGLKSGGSTNPRLSFCSRDATAAVIRDDGTVHHTI